MSNYSDFPFRQCIECDGIGECPHPTVDITGKPIPPEDCPKYDENGNYIGTIIKA